MSEIFKLFAEHSGFEGLVIVSLGAALVMMWKHLNKVQNQLMELQNIRVKEAKEVQEVLMKNAEGTNSALGEVSTTLTLLKDTIMMKIS